jgi:hypothetical protein
MRLNCWKYFLKLLQNARRDFHHSLQEQQGVKSSLFCFFILDLMFWCFFFFFSCLYSVLITQQFDTSVLLACGMRHLVTVRTETATISSEICVVFSCTLSHSSLSNHLTLYTRWFKYDTVTNRNRNPPIANRALLSARVVITLLNELRDP